MSKQKEDGSLHGDPTSRQSYDSTDYHENKTMGVTSVFAMWEEGGEA